MANHRLLLRARAGAAAVAVVLALLPASSAVPTTGGPARIDADLLRQVSAGTTVAVLSWDDDAASRGQVDSYLQQNGVGFHSLEMLDMGFACVSSEDQVRTLAAAPGAISVYGETTMTPTLDRSVPTAFNGNPNDIWNVEGVTGEGVGMAVLDTGIDATHPDLQMPERTLINGRILFSTHDLNGGNGDPCPPLVVFQEAEDSETTSGHGTHLASVAAGDGTASNGKYKGMAPGAELIGLNVADSVTVDRQVLEGTRISMLKVLAGINHILMYGLEGGPTIVKVALMGWTSPGLADPWHPLTLALRDLTDFGVSIVMPTGNQGPAQSDCDQAETCYFNKYAIGKHTIAVGATPSNSRTVLEDYSSRGDPLAHDHMDGPIRYTPTLVAPGSLVTAARRLGLVSFAALPSDHPLGASGAKSRSGTDLSYQTLTGTSVAAAHVAGTIALMQQAALDAKGCFLSATQVKDILKQTATYMPGYAEWEIGSGALDATAAVWGARFAPKVQTREPWNCPPDA